MPVGNAEDEEASNLTYAVSCVTVSVSEKFLVPFEKLSALTVLALILLAPLSKLTPVENDDDGTLPGSDVKVVGASIVKVGAPLYVMPTEALEPLPLSDVT